MAATTAIAASAGSALYSGYQASKKPKAIPLPTLPTAPDPQADAIAKAEAGQQAALVQRRRTAAAAGPRSTILTSPQGLNTPAPGRTLLLGR